MDFKKIGWIFFFAFLGLNIFLFSIYKEADDQEDVVYRTDQKVPIEDRLDSEDISYSGQFSEKHQKGYYISGKPSDMNEVLDEERDRQDDQDLLKDQTSVDDQTLTHSLTEENAITDTSQTSNVLKQFLQEEDQVLFGDEYSYLEDVSSFKGDYPSIIAAQSYEGIPIDDSSSRIEIELSEQDDKWVLSNYTQTHISDLIPLREAISLYSEEEIINTLYVNNKIPSGSEIKWRHLAYTLNLKVRGQNVYVPAWFVAIEDEDGQTQIEKVNALTNRIITNTTVQTVENS
ncbi:MAG: two-component system regulatory protein YycI [Tetragenococcus halophilus]|nr:two-component system regulatory protein YycI [Tetragenococcus halophilus]